MGAGPPRGVDGQNDKVCTRGEHWKKKGQLGKTGRVSGPDVLVVKGGTKIGGANEGGTNDSNLFGERLECQLGGLQARKKKERGRHPPPNKTLNFLCSWKKKSSNIKNTTKGLGDRKKNEKEGEREKESGCKGRPLRGKKTPS